MDFAHLHAYNPRVPPTLVVVTGPPGSGKTTLAHVLARAIPCPAVCRDEIKEGLVHAHGAGYEAAPGDELTQSALRLFFAVVRTLLDGGATVVAEAAFQDPLWRCGLDPLADLAELRVIRCRVDPHVARDRAARRAATEGGRRAHGDSTLREARDEWSAFHEGFGWITLPAPALDVDTDDGYAPELAEVVAFAGGG